MGKGKLLLVEDEQSVADPIQRGLTEEGYQVDHARDGQEGLLLALTGSYDALILDWRLPGMDGLSIVERIRGAKSRLPVLMLTAMRDIDYRVEGLNAGADDYLTKPFSFEELLARIRALMRRNLEARKPVGMDQVLLAAGPLQMDTIRRTVHLNGRLLILRMKEFQLLEVLMRRLDEVVTRTYIAELVWGSPFEVTDNAIDVTVSNLRQHLETDIAENSQHIVLETVRGVGYRLILHSASE